MRGNRTKVEKDFILKLKIGLTKQEDWTKVENSRCKVEKNMT